MPQKYHIEVSVSGVMKSITRCVPHPKKDLDIGLLNKLFKQAGLN